MPDEASGEHPDPPSGSNILTLIVRGACPLEADLGEGRERRVALPGMISVTPAGTACDFALHGEVGALAVHPPAGPVTSFGVSAGVLPVDDLGPCHGGIHDPLVEAHCCRL